MNLEQTKNAAANIRRQMDELKEIEDVLRLAQLCHYTKSLFEHGRFKTEEFKIEPTDKRDRYDVFKISYQYEEQPLYSKGFYTILYCNCVHTQTLEFKDEYTYLMKLIKKEDVSSIIVRKDTTVEDFLGQISDKYKTIYMAYELENDLTVNNTVNKARSKL